MKIILEPEVNIIGAMHFYGHSKYKIPRDGNDAVKLCSFAAKACYDSFGENGRNNKENQAAIIESRHGSVVEHYHISLFIEGITRGLSLELNRHRHFNVSQRSTRYTAEEDTAIVLEPYYAEMYRRCAEGDGTAPELDFMHDHLTQIEHAFDQYKYEVVKLMEQNPLSLTGTSLRKWARGKARNVLPHALETRGTWTGNIRTWRHFLEMRSAQGAEAEIRRLSNRVFDVLHAVIPDYLLDYDIKMVEGFYEYTTKNTKI